MNTLKSRSALISNVLAVITDYHEDIVSAGPGFNTLNDVMDGLFGCVDWDAVPVDVIRSVVRLVLKNAPLGDAMDVSERADDERHMLKVIKSDRAKDAAEFPHAYEPTYQREQRAHRRDVN